MFKYIRAIIRLILNCIMFFLAGLERIIFEGKEVISYNFIYDDMPEDKEKISFIKRMNRND